MPAEKEVTKDFYAEINYWSSKFKAQTYEDLYMAQRLASFPRSRCAKAVFVYYALVSLWNLANYILPISENKYEAEYSLGIFTAATTSMLLEVLFIYKAFIFRGLPIMLVSFFYAFSYSYSRTASFPALTHSGAFLILCAFSLSMHYVYSWLTAAGAFAVGLGIGIYYLHDTNYALPDVLWMYAFLTVLIIAMIMNCHAWERADRFNFFSLQKQAEAHKLYKHLLAHIPTGIMIVDKDAHLCFINDWVKTLMASPRDNASNTSRRSSPGGSMLVHTSPVNEELLPGETDKKSSQHIERFLSAVHTADGQRLGEVLLSNDSALKFMYETQGKVHHFTTSSCEVQYKKRRCNAIVIHDHTSVQELSKLEEKYMKILLASVVHDIRTPIQGIIGVLEALNTGVRTAEERQYLQIGQNTCKLLTFLTYDITDLGQLEAGKFKVEHSTFYPTEAVQDCVNSLSFSYNAKGIGLSVVPGSDVAKLPVFSDEHRYMQIIMNLLGNAMKFTPRGGSVTVTLSRDMASDTLLTEVKDTGVGIKEEELPNLFKLFGRLQSSAAMNPHGVGLGLTICKKLSVQLGGDITVASKYGTGTTFSFGIKANKDDCEFGGSFDAGSGLAEDKIQLEENPREMMAHEHSFGSGPDTHKALMKVLATDFSQIARTAAVRSLCSCPKLLIVDDTPHNLFVIHGYAKSMSIPCEEANNGEEAVQMVLAKANSVPCCQKYSVILMDINMPIMDGIEAGTAIQNLVKEGKVPDGQRIVALTGDHFSEEEEEKIRAAAGIVAFYLKPLTKAKFEEIIGRYPML